jgi:hypothetical protein
LALAAWQTFVDTSDFSSLFCCAGTRALEENKFMQEGAREPPTPFLLGILEKKM